jgi:hypothetical protein
MNKNALSYRAFEVTGIGLSRVVTPQPFRTTNVVSSSECAKGLGYATGSAELRSFSWVINNS